MATTKASGRRKPSARKPPPQCHDRSGDVRCQLPRGHQSRHANVEGDELVMWRREPDPPRTEEPASAPEPDEDAGQPADRVAGGDTV